MSTATLPFYLYTIEHRIPFDHKDLNEHFKCFEKAFGDDLIFKRMFIERVQSILSNLSDSKAKTYQYKMELIRFQNLDQKAQEFLKTLIGLEMKILPAALKIGFEIPSSFEDDTLYLELPKKRINLTDIMIRSKNIRLNPLTRDQLEEMRVRGELTDFTIQLKAEILKVHKLVLGLSSPFFRKMFSNNMKESVEHTIDLSFENENNVKLLIDFMYKNSIVLNNPTLSQFIEFIKLTHRFEVTDLFDLCVKKLYKRICIESLFEIYDFACLYDNKVLHELCLNYCKNGLLLDSEIKELFDKAKKLNLKEIEELLEKRLKK